MNRIKFLFGLISLLFLTSCESNVPEDTKREKLTNKIPQQEVVTPKKELPTTQIKFEEYSKSILPKDSDEKIIVEYHFINIGKNPLYIESCKGSIQFTSTYNKNPILPNEKGKIIGEFTTTSVKEDITRHLVLRANTEPRNTTLQLKVKY